MTLRRPSKISLSFLLSSSFLICDTEAVREAYEDGLKLLTELADWAASRVSSRAVRKAISQLYACGCFSSVGGAGGIAVELGS